MPPLLGLLWDINTLYIRLCRFLNSQISLGWRGTDIFAKKVCDIMTAWSTTTRTRVSVFNNWHTENYFTLEKVKTKEKSFKKCNFLFSKIGCPRTLWLYWHGVSIVNDYADTDYGLHGHFRKTWRLLTDFKGTIRWKRFLGMFTNPIAII